jgi:hypothetical protein
MEKTSMSKAFAAIIGGMATIAAVYFSFNVDWLSPEVTLTLGTALNALLVYMVPNKPIE